MRRHLILAIPVVTFSIVLLLNLGFCSQLLANDEFDLFGYSDEVGVGYIDYYFNLTKGQTVSINISVTGDPTTFGIANASGFLYEPPSIVSSRALQTTWPVPYNDTYTFHFGTGGALAVSHVHFEAALVDQVPEYSVNSILVLFMTTMLFVAVFSKQKHSRKGQQSTTIAHRASNLFALAQDYKKLSDLNGSTTMLVNCCDQERNESKDHCHAQAVLAENIDPQGKGGR